MKINETIEIESESLIQYILFMGREIAEWETYFPEDLASEEEAWDGIHPRNVTEIEYLGDGAVEVRGEFTVAVVVDYIRGSWEHPPEVKTEQRETLFSLTFWLEDEGYSEGRIEVV